MTPEQIHDALTLLPSDLIAEVDEKRNRKPKVIPLKRYAAMAASFVLVLCSGLYCLQLFGGMGASKETSALPPMAAQDNSLRAEAAPQSPDTQAAPAETAEEFCGVPTAPKEEPASGNAEEAPASGHSHAPAESFAEDEQASTGATCGNTTATLYYGEHVYPLSGSSAVTVTNILYHLHYDPAMLCSCLPEITIDTELGTGYAISLTDHFVRHDGGQAALTIEQAEVLKQAIEDSLPSLDELSYSTHQVITPSLEGYHSDHSVTLITSRQELEVYWATFAQRYDFSDMTFICDTYGYDDSWFEKNDLLLNVVHSRTGVTYDVTAITNAGSNKGWEWEVLISIQGLFYPENAETTYHLITRLEKDMMHPEDDIVQVFDVYEAESTEEG